MRILIVIPHYYGPGPAHYGSTDQSQRKSRIASLRKTIASAHQHLGNGQQMYSHGREVVPVNQAIASQVDVVVCTTGKHHLLDELGLPRNCYRQHAAQVDNPLFLGYSCYEVFRQAFGSYDWYCYMEDDLVLTDPLFFTKLQVFYETVRDARYLLQPHRFEVGENEFCSKTYIDGPLWENSDAMKKMRLPDSVERIELPFLGSAFPMLPAENPHSGCFFLRSEHLQHLLEQPWYGKKVVGYAGPLESAATLFILTVFHIFKPAPECAGFLEVHHSHQRYIP